MWTTVCPFREKQTDVQAKIKKTPSLSSALAAVRRGEASWGSGRGSLQK